MMLTYKKMKEMELSLMRKSDLTLLTSLEEEKILHEEDSSLKFAILSNIHITEDVIPEFDSRKDMMFLGGFQHPPNIDAAEYLVKEIFPKIKEKINDIKLFIVGSNPPEQIKNLASTDVLVTGYVKDIRPYFQNCRIMVSPLRFGAGVKGKITQSLSFGLPVITTSIGAESINLKDGKNCMIADDKTLFAEKAVKLYSDKKLWEKISQNSIKLSNQYSPEITQKLFENIFINLGLRNTNLKNSQQVIKTK